MDAYRAGAVRRVYWETAMMILDCVELPTRPASTTILGAVRLQKTRENDTRPQEVREGASVHSGYEAIDKRRKTP